jgi:hypothetical protein
MQLFIEIEKTKIFFTAHISNILNYILLPKILKLKCLNSFLSLFVQYGAFYLINFFIKETFIVNRVR